MAIGQEHTYPIDARAEFKTPTRLAPEGKETGFGLTRTGVKISSDGAFLQSC